MLPFLYSSEKLFSEKNGLTLSSLVEARRIESQAIGLLTWDFLDFVTTRVTCDMNSHCQLNFRIVPHETRNVSTSLSILQKL